nr:thyrotropin-releasing hormone receptor-like [Lepeophtheirus salmonis]
MASSNDSFVAYLNESLSLCLENGNKSRPCDVSDKNTTEVTCKDQEYYSFSYALVGTLFQSIIFIVGVAGNGLVCAVVKKTKSMHSTTNCYLVSLAIADTITLVSSVPQEILSYHILGDQWVWGSLGCTLMIYLQYLGINASALSLTAFTIERYLAICHPIRSKPICTISRAKKIILFCWTFAMTYCSPWLLLTKTRTGCVKFDYWNINDHIVLHQDDETNHNNFVSQ